MKAKVEYTDTFGGDANYSWCERYSFDCTGMTDLAITRKAKKLCNLNGVRGKANVIGDMLEFRPFGMCTIMFITFNDHE